MEDKLLKILLVDDEEPIRQLIQNFLISKGSFEVITCESGESAISEIEREKFDVIILDYKMAGISGLNVMQWMHEQKVDTPLIMLTAAGSEAIAVEAMKFGAYEYIRKERLDLEYLPIIINSIHQQFLFRKEKESSKAIEQTLQKHISEYEIIFESLRNNVTTLNQSIQSISSNLEGLEKRIILETTYDGYVQVVNPIMVLQDYATLASLALETIFELIEKQKVKMETDKKRIFDNEKSSDVVLTETSGNTKRS